MKLTYFAYIVSSGVLCCKKSYSKHQLFLQMLFNTSLEYIFVKYKIVLKKKNEFEQSNSD